jgi:hypothetical protein
MPQIIVDREAGSLADRFRPYTVIIDGKVRGTIRHSERCAFAVPGGTHSVSFQAGDYYSPPLKVAVVNSTRLTCWSTMAHALGLMAWVPASSWISIREEDGFADAAELIAMPCEEADKDSFESRRTRLWRGGNVRLRPQAAQRSPAI